MSAAHPQRAAGLQLLAGAAMIAITGPFLDGRPGPMVAAIAICAVLALATAIATLRPRPAASPSAAE